MGLACFNLLRDTICTLGQGWITVDSYRLPVIDNPGFLTTMSLNPPPLILLHRSLTPQGNPALLLARESMAQDPPTDEQPAQFLATIVNQFIEQGMQDEELATPPLLTPVTNHPLIRLDALFYFS